MMPILRPLRREQRISDADLALGARLLVHAQPLPKSESRKRRIWNALNAAGHSRLGFRLSALHVAFASVLFAAASSAAVGTYYAQQREAEVSEAPASVVPPAPRKARSAAKRRPQAPIAEAEPQAPADETTDAPLAVAPRLAPARSRSDSGVRGKAADADAQLLVEAMRARSAGDAKRVSELVEQYRTKHPQGVLQEEALILSIESAVARHSPNAGALAREYLSRFPGGRFSAQARRALGEAAR